MDYKKIITKVFNEVKAGENQGQVSGYIPELANVNPEKFGVYLTSLNHLEVGMGDCQEKFSIQSIAKVFSLTLAYRILGEKIWERLGVEPSGTAFN